MHERRFREAADEIKAALEGKLYAILTDDENVGQLDECFREARELVDSASVLLQCPQRTRERLVLSFVFVTVGTMGVISSTVNTPPYRGLRVLGIVIFGSGGSLKNVHNTNFSPDGPTSC